jgi:MoxR-like ATPase
MNMEESQLSQAREYCELILKAVSGVFVGHQLLLKKLLAAGLSNGHVLFEDNPGLGKTLLAKVFARVIGFNYARIQFTPDLLPADILGTKIWRQKDATFELMKGPVFTNLLLADEINRTPPKTQAALLEAMEERQVTIEGETHPLPAPFFVLATQNPIEQEGTYPLPEAQLDRFTLKLSTGYAETLEEESTILMRRIQWHKDDPSGEVKAVITNEQFLKLQFEAENEVYIDRCILDYVSQIIRNTRQHPRIEIGASPRGGLALLKLSRAFALIEGRDFVVPDDIKFFAADSLSHRIILNLEDTLDGQNPRKIIEEIVEKVPAPTDFYPR